VVGLVETPVPVVEPVETPPVVELVETPAGGRARRDPRRVGRASATVLRPAGRLRVAVVEGPGDGVAVRCGRARGGHRRCLGTRSRVVVVPVVAVADPGSRLPSRPTRRLARFCLRSCQGPVEQGVL